MNWLSTSRGGRGSPWALALLGLAVLVGCEETPQFSAERTLTSTVTLSREDTVAIDSIVPLVVWGDVRGDAIYATLRATITASTSTRAEQLAEDLALQVETSGRRVSIRLAKPDEATLTGTLEVSMPADLQLEAIERASTIDVSGLRGDIGIVSRSHARVAGARRDVQVAVGTGNALVDADLAAGTGVRISVQQGDIELSVPPSISADVTAVLGQGGGQVVVDHAQLPPAPGSAGQPYRAVVGGGLSVVNLESGAGRIVIRHR